MAERFTRAEYALPSERLAPLLLGQRLIHLTPGGRRVGGIIVECEAYTGVEDRAAHSFGGRRTPRNEAMYAVPGTSYVYFTYGMHFCFNVVCGELDEPVAVLIRALQPEEGLSLMRRRRNARRKPGAAALKETELCSGPAKVCQALALDRRQNGLDMCHPGARLFIERSADPAERKPIRRGPRIGIGDCGPWTEKPLRYWLSNSPHVSR